MRFFHYSLTLAFTAVPIFLCAENSPDLSKLSSLLIKQSKGEPLRIEPIAIPPQPSTSTLMVAVGVSQPVENRMVTSSLTVVDYTVLSEKTMASTSLELYFYSVPTEVITTKTFPMLMTTHNTQTASCISIIPTHNLQAAQKTHVFNNNSVEKILKQVTLSPPPVQKCPTYTVPAVMEPPMEFQVVKMPQVVNIPKIHYEEVEMDVLDMDCNKSSDVRRIKLGKKKNKDTKKESLKIVDQDEAEGKEKDKQEYQSRVEKGDLKKASAENLSEESNNPKKREKKKESSWKFWKTKQSKEDDDSDFSDEMKKPKNKKGKEDIVMNEESKKEPEKESVASADNKPEGK